MSTGFRPTALASVAVLLAASLVAASLFTARPARADEVDDWFEKYAKHGLRAKASGRVPEPSPYPRVELRGTIVPPEGDEGPTGNVEIGLNNLLQDKRYVRFQVTHCRMWTGAILPVLGRLHVAAIDREKDGSGSIYLSRLPADRVPEGISFRKDSLVLPSPVGTERSLSALIGTHSSIKGDAAFVAGPFVWEIETPKDGRPAATISAVSREQKWPRVKIAAGDYLQLGDVGHEVLAIVPRDRKRNILGWIELAGEPIPLAKLAEKNTTVVNPKPKD